jgi:hypothetical protein
MTTVYAMIMALIRIEDDVRINKDVVANKKTQFKLHGQLEDLSRSL